MMDDKIRDNGKIAKVIKGKGQGQERIHASKIFCVGKDRKIVDIP